jgi:hypothetical protein
MMERGQVSNSEKDNIKQQPSETSGLDEEKWACALQREDTAEADALTAAISELEEAKPDNSEDITTTTAVTVQ